MVTTESDVTDIGTKILNFNGVGFAYFAFSIGNLSQGTWKKIGTISQGNNFSFQAPMLSLNDGTHVGIIRLSSSNQAISVFPTKTGNQQIAANAISLE